jgi:hypothetical protein
MAGEERVKRRSLKESGIGDLTPEKSRALIIKQHIIEYYKAQSRKIINLLKD